MNTNGKIQTRRPAWAKALIVAELVEDKSDIMTDYFASTSTRCVALAWSKHTRDLFSEMRKAAETFEPTKHLGPGRDVWTARVVFAEDPPDDGFIDGRYRKGQRSHWHGDLYPNGLDAPTFETKAEAEDYVNARGVPEPITMSGGNGPTRFEWEITCESVEHREKWSMGAGYYLKAGYRHGSGWRVKKQTYQIPDTLEAPAAAATA